jgi:lipoprotein-anchoring transpeptidase ErfK/SrfK
MKSWVMQIVMAAAVSTASQAWGQAAGNREIVVSLEDRKLALVEGGEVRKVYAVAVGKPSTPSPEGAFTIERRVANPTYSHNGVTVAPGPRNPVGSRWMGLSIRGYGIHGTNEPKSIGKAASHGCIRMAKADLEEFYDLVQVGDAVRIVSKPDEQTARLFAPAASEPVVAATEKPEPAGVQSVASPALVAAGNDKAASASGTSAGNR